MPSALLVDDEPNIRRFLRFALRSAGYQVIEAESYAQAQRCLASSWYDLALLDVQLPDGSGLDLARWLSAERPDTSVIVISADDRNADQALSLGADWFLPKPFSHGALVAAVHGLQVNA